jgi:purine-binding chemotaxis protein CheW
MQTDSEPFILIELAGTTYGVRGRFVQQMEMIEHITPIPNAPAALEGVVLARGQVIPALSLRGRFGFEKIPYDLRTRLLVVNNGKRTIGLIADTAREFVKLPLDAIEPTPEALSGLSGNYLEGIATLNGRMILILNLDEVINIESMELATEKDA